MGFIGGRGGGREFQGVRVGERDLQCVRFGHVSERVVLKCSVCQGGSVLG